MLSFLQKQISKDYLAWIKNVHYMRLIHLRTKYKRNCLVKILFFKKRLRLTVFKIGPLIISKLVIEMS